MEKIYTEVELGKHNISHLKCILAGRGLKMTGKKAEMVARILEDQRSIPIWEKETLRGNTYFDLLPLDVINEINKYRAENNPQNKIAEKIINSLSPNHKEVEKLNIIFKKYEIPYSLIENERRKELVAEAQRLSAQTNQFLYEIWKRSGVYEMPIYISKSTGRNLVSDRALIELIGALLIRGSVNMDNINEILGQFESDLLVTRINIGPREGEKKDRYRYKIGRFRSDKEFVI